MDHLTDQPLPQAIDAEQSVLGALMLEPRALVKISDWLKAEDFYRRDHQLIYKALCGLIDKGSPVDAVTVSDWFQGAGLTEMLESGGYLLHLSNSTASAANIIAYAEIVLEKSKLRQLIERGTRMVEAARAVTADSRHIVSDAAYALAQMQTSAQRAGLEPAKVALKKLMASRLERYNKPGQLLGLPTPWLELNKALKGLRDGQLYVLGARPNMGKSVGGVQIAAFTAARGQRVAFFSVEMTDEQCMSRALACLGEIDHGWVDDPHTAVEDIEVADHRFMSTMSTLLESDLLIDASPGLNVEQFMGRARRAHMQKPIRLVVLDHMHDMAINPKAEARHEYGRIAQAGKTLAKEFNCPVILLAQLNRSAAQRGDPRPKMSDLRESGEIEQKADVILFLHREDYYDPNTPNKGVVEVIVGKGRDIKTGTVIYLENRYDQMRLGDLDEDYTPRLPAPPAQKSSMGGLAPSTRRHGSFS